MKKSLLILLLAIALRPIPLHSNPIIARWFSEIVADSTSWAVELITYDDSVSLDGWYLASNSGQAAFRSGLVLRYLQYLVITQDDLQNEFHINPAGDRLQLIAHGSLVRDDITIGPLQHGQSWSLEADWYYLDNSPTLGQSNDTLNAMCQIEGTVTDINGFPVGEITAYWSYSTWWPERSLVVDSAGHFSLRVLANSINFMFQKTNYKTLRSEVQAYPESTITVQLTLEVVDAVEQTPDEGTSGYALNASYPNPFNGRMSFTYRISRDEFVDVSVFDVQGRLVENLQSGFQAKGEYRLVWAPLSAPSGIYFYRLRTPHFMMSKKCSLMK